MTKKSLLFCLLVQFFCTCLMAQQIGSRVSLVAVDGKSYTGVITEINNGQYKIKYDGYDFSSWLTSTQFTVLNATQPAGPRNQQQPQQPVEQTGNWKVGDKVDAQDMYNNYAWVPVTIIRVNSEYNPPTYSATLDNPAGHAITQLLLNAKQIRPRGVKSNHSFSVGSRVDVYYSSGEPKNRATVIENKGNGKFKIKYDGCADHWDEEVDWSQLKPESVVSSNDPDITATFGKWAMFVYSYPNTIIRGNDVYREYGMGAKAPPLQINANGSYVWYDEFNKPPVKGHWSTHAKIKGVKVGTEAANGIILRDSHGIHWKIRKDRADHIEARQMCSGITKGGTKIK